MYHVAICATGQAQSNTETLLQTAAGSLTGVKMSYECCPPSPRLVDADPNSDLSSLVVLFNDSLHWPAGILVSIMPKQAQAFMSPVR